MNQQLNNKRYSFGGHEKFVFRQGWLKKGVEGLNNNPHVFTEENALVYLGVGKNMVRSIRFWCLATGMIDEVDSGNRTSVLRVSEFGKNLLGENGWDEYLEDIGSLWLIHWQLSTNLLRSLVWFYVFSKFLELEYNKKQLLNFLSQQFINREIRVSFATIEREIDVCLRTYIPGTRNVSSSINEESLDCPLAELDIIRFLPEDNLFRFNIGPKSSLPVEIFGYTFLLFLIPIINTRRTISIDECLYKEGSPGQIFKLDENSVIEYIEQLETKTRGRIRLQETAGLRQIYLDILTVDEMKDYALSLLKDYYGRK